ncbi:hypothetical protein GGF37_001206 [Kickxella alabastrina]|nr:hypothetical protein GGF37_001206 [Kickxella alabastrina]
MTSQRIREDGFILNDPRKNRLAGQGHVTGSYGSGVNQDGDYMNRAGELFDEDPWSKKDERQEQKYRPTWMQRIQDDPSNLFLPGDAKDPPSIALGRASQAGHGAPSQYERQEDRHVDPMLRFDRETDNRAHDLVQARMARDNNGRGAASSTYVYDGITGSTAANRRVGSVAGSVHDGPEDQHRRTGLHNNMDRAFGNTGGGSIYGDMVNGSGRTQVPKTSNYGNISSRLAEHSDARGPPFAKSYSMGQPQANTSGDMYNDITHTLHSKRPVTAIGPGNNMNTGFEDSYNNQHDSNHYSNQLGTRLHFAPPPRPVSLMGRNATPGNRDYGGGLVRNVVQTPYTVRIKGPGAFPATAQRFSQRKASDSRNADDNVLSPTVARPGVQAGDMLASHRYLNHGATHSGWGMYGASVRGDNDGGATERSFNGSMISNSTDAATVIGDNPTLLRRLLRNIAASWTGTLAERLSFVLLMLYFLVKESVAISLRFVLHLIVSSVRGSARSLAALIVVSLAAALATQYTRPFTTGLGSVLGPAFGLIFGSSSSSRTSATKPIAPMSSEDIARLGGAGSAVVDRLQQVEKTLQQLYILVDELKAHQAEDTADARDALERLQAERRTLLESIRGDKQRVDALERDHASIKRDVARASAVAASTHDVQALRRQVDKLASAAKAAKSESGGLFGSRGLSASAVRKVVDEAIRAHEAEMRAMMAPSWLESDGDAAYANVARMIDSALSRFASDRLAKTDFALMSAGARIIPGLTSPTFEPRVRGLVRNLFRVFGSTSSLPPATVLDPSTHIGECWPMRGSSGQVAVHLAAPIDITEFALEHVPKAMAIDWRSAPRSVEVWGYVLQTNASGSSSASASASAFESASTPAFADSASFDQRLDNREPAPVTSAEPASHAIVNPPFAASGLASGAALGKLTLLATYEYTPSDAEPVQIIPTLPQAEGRHSDGTIRARTVILKINSNWGHPDHTCIYRFRVHGFQPFL